MTQTEKIVKKMMTQPIAHCLCDSGEAYGYAYERRGQIEKEPWATVEWWEDDRGLTGSITLSLYHHMCDLLDYDPVATAAFNAFCRKEKEAPWGTCVFEAFGDYLGKKVKCDNSYNYDNPYNACFLFGLLPLGDSTEDFPSHIIISTHNGCDVRGGYSDAKVFKTKMADDIYIFLLPSGRVYCPKCDKDLDDYETTSVHLDKDEYTTDPSDTTKWLYKEGKVYCPDCKVEVSVI